MKMLKALKKRIRRWWNGPANVSALDVALYMYDKELLEVIEQGRPSGVSMELLDSYITFRNEGLEPEEAKQSAMREWDL